MIKKLTRILACFLTFCLVADSCPAVTVSNFSAKLILQPVDSRFFEQAINATLPNFGGDMPNKTAKIGEYKAGGNFTRHIALSAVLVKAPVLPAIAFALAIGLNSLTGTAVAAGLEAVPPFLRQSPALLQMHPWYSSPSVWIGFLVVVSVAAITASVIKLNRSRRHVEETKLSELDILGTGQSEEWQRLMTEENRWHPGVNFNELFNGEDVLVLGDTDHSFLGIARGLIDHLEELAAAGVTHLILEVDSDQKVENMVEIAQGTWIPHRALQLVRKAEALGIQVQFMDKPHVERDPSWGEDRWTFERGAYMGRYVAAELQKSRETNPNSRMIVLTGYAHLQDPNQIPAGLDAAGIRYGRYALMSGGQQGRVFGMATFFSPSVVDAVARISDPSQTYGIIDLGGLNYPVDGVIHFPRPAPEAPTARALPAAEASTALILKGWSASAPAPIPQPLSQPLHMNFEDRVASDSFGWPETNEQKIVEFVSHLQGLTHGQRMYLALMLFSFARNTGRHNLSGSIVTMGFVPEGQFFELSVVDCCGYPYHPGGNYGALQRHYEISLRTLEQQFGFADILIRDLREVGPVGVSNAYDRPLAIPRILALVLAVRRHPERAVVDGNKLRIYRSDYSGDIRQGTVITEMEVEDFTLNEREQLLMQISKPLDEAATLVQYGFWALGRATEGSWLRKGTMWPWEKKQFENINAELRDISLHRFRFEYAMKAAILNARRELRNINDAEVEPLMDIFDKRITEFTHTIEMAEQFAKSYPELAARTDRHGVNVLNTIDKAKAHLAGLQAIEAQIRLRRGISGGLPSDSEEQVYRQIQELLTPSIPGVDQRRDLAQRIMSAPGSADRSLLEANLPGNVRSKIMTLLSGETAVTDAYGSIPLAERQVFIDPLGSRPEVRAILAAFRLHQITRRSALKKLVERGLDPGLAEANLLQASAPSAMNTRSDPDGIRARAESILQGYVGFLVRAISTEFDMTRRANLERLLNQVDALLKLLREGGDPGQILEAALALNDEINGLATIVQVQRTAVERPETAHTAARKEQGDVNEVTLAPGMTYNRDDLDALRRIMDTTPNPVLVIKGNPGSGKSMLFTALLGGRIQTRRAASTRYVQGARLHDFYDCIVRGQSEAYLRLNFEAYVGMISPGQFQRLLADFANKDELDQLMASSFDEFFERFLQAVVTTSDPPQAIVYLQDVRNEPRAVLQKTKVLDRPYFVRSVDV